MNINVRIIRSNRKNLSIELKPNEIIARAPMRMEDKEIYKFIESKQSWIDKHLTKQFQKQFVMCVQVNVWQRTGLQTSTKILKTVARKDKSVLY